MTSASELFLHRRHRYGLRHSSGDDPWFDFPPSDASSSSSHQHRSSIRRHQNNRRERRPDLDGCVFGIHRRRPNQLEQEAVEEEEIINCDESRLPGSVLLARERLVERLRGISVSRNRRVSRGRGSSSSSTSSRYETELELRNNDRMGRSESGGRLGLNEDELKRLEREVFSNEKKDETECCTICLEGYKDGDELIRLHCKHTFHSRCLFPWFRVCAACPNCRKPSLCL